MRTAFRFTKPADKQQTILITKLHASIILSDTGVPAPPGSTRRAEHRL